VQEGAAVFDPSVLARILPGIGRTEVPEAFGSDLTQRERQVLQLLAQGSTTTSIAEELALSRATVRNHIQNTLTKLHAHSKLEAVTIALRNGLARTV
jgi:DNA-binding NarL/FixJ family response regulator